jgi:hypothetical protein
MHVTEEQIIAAGVAVQLIGSAVRHFLHRPADIAREQRIERSCRVILDTLAQRSYRKLP